MRFPHQIAIRIQHLFAYPTCGPASLGAAEKKQNQKLFRFFYFRNHIGFPTVVASLEVSTPK